MLTPVELGTVAAASLGGLTMAWGNIKGVFARFESLFIVKAQLQGNMSYDFMNYCWAKFKVSPIGVRQFHAGDYFVRPKNRLGRVATEGYGKFVTFWYGYRPIFLSKSDTKNGDDNSIAHISFIRGTFNLEKLLIDAVNFYDSAKHEKNDKSSRYYVRRCFGRKKSKDGDQSDSIQPSSGKTVQSDEMSEYFRPLFYNKDDIGIPTSKKPMDNLAYEDGVQEFYNEVVRWKESKQWFNDKGLSWRLGGGIFGPPGTGKSSLARAIGQSLDMPIHSYDLTTMDNQELVDNWQYSLGESPCIVLLEDIDRIFDENKQIKTSRDKSPLTLDCLLNCISGVQPSDGILVLVTANNVTKLDPALGVPDSSGKSTRPGRLDRAIYIGILDKAGREKIAKRILSDVSELVDKTVFEGEGETGAQFERRCSTLALDHYWGRIGLPLIAAVPGIKSLDDLRREGSYDA